MDLEKFRAKVKKEGEALGWQPFAEAVGVAKETLRVFANTEGRALQPTTRRALETYFAKSLGKLTSRDAQDIAATLLLLRKAVVTQEQLLARLTELEEIDAHVDDEIATRTERADEKRA